MPSYVGIGTSITHNVEVDGNLFLQDIEGGPDSTRVPLEIFSNLVSSSVESANSRMLRLRVQNYGETNTDNSYVTDMGIRGDPGKDYFFITAPQNTSNVGDQNTFVISTTSNVGIGTTNPEKPLHVVGDSWITGTLTASNIIGASPVTISSNLVMASGFTLTAGAIEPPAGSESNLKITGTITTSNIVANSGDSLLVSSNLEVGTSNLFVDTATGNVGIGTDSPVAKLDVAGSSTSGKSLQLRSGDVLSGTDSSQIIFSYDGNPYNAGGYAHSIRTRHNSIADTGNAIDFWLWNTSDTADSNTLGNKRVMTIEGNGNVGIGIASPTYKLHVDGVIKSSTPSWNLYKSAAAPTGNNTGTLSFDTIKASAVNCTINTSGGYYYRVTITVAGRYFVGFNAFTETNQTGFIQCYIRINGNNYVRTYTRIPTYPVSTQTWGAMGGMGAVIDLNVNDYVEILNNGTVYVHEFDNASFYGFMI
jgi:hypothetical protein